MPKRNHTPGSMADAQLGLSRSAILGEGGPCACSSALNFSRFLHEAYFWDFGDAGILSSAPRRRRNPKRWGTARILAPGRGNKEGGDFAVSMRERKICRVILIFFSPFYSYFSY